MDYVNMPKWQVINAMFSGNPAGLSVQQITNRLGLKSEFQVYKWGQSPDAAGCDIPEKYILPLSIMTADKRLVEWYAAQIGYRLVKIDGPVITDGDVMDQFFNTVEMVGELTREVREDLEDGRLDNHEKKRLRTIIERMVRELVTFAQELRET